MLDMMKDQTKRAASALDDFESWWVEHGQYCRAGGGAYEKSFAFSAWQAATTIEREACAVVAENFSTRDGYEISHSIRGRSNT